MDEQIYQQCDTKTTKQTDRLTSVCTNIMKLFTCSSQVSDVSPPVAIELLSINSVGEGDTPTTLFREGAYSFLYSATDQQGNEGFCTVDLTVRGLSYQKCCLYVVYQVITEVRLQDVLIAPVVEEPSLLIVLIKCGVSQRISTSSPHSLPHQHLSL